MGTTWTDEATGAAITRSIADQVAADQETVAADKAIVADDKATVASDKATVTALASQVTADAADVAADKLEVAADALAAAGSASDAAASAAGIAANAAQIPLGRINLIPNAEWFVTTGWLPVTMQKPDGSGDMTAVSVSSYTTGSNSVTCTASNTQQLADGMLGRFSAAADVHMRQVTASDGATTFAFSCQVESLSANASFAVRLPRDLTPSSSAACTFTPITTGDLTGSTGDGPDGWGKTTTLRAWRDVHAANRRYGSKYQIGVKKGAAGSEYFYRSIPSRDLARYRGRTVVFGICVKHGIKGGAGTWRVGINDGVNTTSSAAASDTGYTWLYVSKTIDAAATQVFAWVELQGASGDVYYIAKPMLTFGSTLSEESFTPMPSERIIPTVKTTPATWYGATHTTPAATDAEGLHSTTVRLYPETNGVICPEVVAIDAQFEGKGAAGMTGKYIAVRDQVSPSKFGVAPLYCHIEGLYCAASGSIPLSNGTFTVYGGEAGVEFDYTSFDINGYLLS